MKLEININFVGMADIIKRLTKMDESITRIEESVAELTTQSESVIALLTEVAQLVRDNADDPARLDQIAANIEARASALAAAVANNVDVDPTP